MANGNGTVGKIFNIILKVFTGLVVAFAAFMMVFTIFSSSVYDKSDGTDVFGYRFLSVLSNSMSKSEKNKDDKVHFNTEDIIIIKEMKDATKDGREYKKGDIIAFNTFKEGKYVTVTHMIEEVKNVDGKIQYVTKGTNTGAIDENAVLPQDIIGQYVGKLPKAALFLSYLKSPMGYIVCILIPFLILIGYNGLNCILLFRRYKKEQTEEMNAERAKIEAERDQALEMMKELESLKAQMAAGNAAPAQTAAPVVAEAPVEAAEAAVETAAEAETVVEPAAVEDSAAKALEEEQRKAQEMQKELEALKAQLALEEEKRKTLEMQRELEALKAQLAQKNNENN